MLSMMRGLQVLRWQTAEHCRTYNAKETAVALFVFRAFVIFLCIIRSL